MNKYTIRRFIASIITIPIALTGYFLIWALLIGYGAVGTFEQFKDNLPLISVAWVLAWTFGPDIERYIERRNAQRD